MKIILLKDIKNLGKKNEIKKVNDGYAANFLIPNKYAVIYSEENEKKLIKQLEIEEKNLKIKISHLNDLKKQIEQTTLQFSIKEKNGKSFGSISSKEIIEQLNSKLNSKFEKKDLLIHENYKHPGFYKNELKLGQDIKAIINIKISSLNA